MKKEKGKSNPNFIHEDLIYHRFGKLCVIGYLGKNQWVCKCECGQKVNVKTSSLKSGYKQSCGKCKKESVGECLTSLVLDINDIKYVKQKSFSDLKHKNMLKFDFYLPTQNVAIEYNGKQHYKPVDYFGGDKSFISQECRDKIKRSYCKSHGIGLIEIPYTCDNEFKIENFLIEHNIIKGEKNAKS